MPSESTSNETTTVLESSSASSSKPLMKLKRFFSTLYHFGSDISSEIGERVRALILALVNNALSVEEFHGKVQSTTNFPLRPFALPFLKSTLPSLQKELSQLARQARQSTNQYLVQHEEYILLPRESLEPNSSSSSTSPPMKDQINENGKRMLTEEFHSIDDRSLSHKRTSTNQHVGHSRSILPANTGNTLRRDFREKERAFTAYLREYGTDYSKGLDDEWKNAENMLNCILEMVTKAKRVLFVLQQKDNHIRRLIETNDLEWRRRQAELVAQTEDRIVDIRRKTEETVLEIKRQSMLDLQKVVSQTEQKSSKLLIREREQYQRLNQTFEEAYALLNRQEDGPEQCWHCGRKAIETCSGCNLTRYCGQYCQHRDWDFHQTLCGPDLKRKYADNPSLVRRFASKTVIHHLSNELKKDSTDSSTSPGIVLMTNSNSTSDEEDIVKCETVL